MKKTNVQMLSRVNYDVFRKYLKLMITLELIDVTYNSKEELLTLNDKGKVMLSKMLALLEEMKVLV